MGRDAVDSITSRERGEVTALAVGPRGLIVSAEPHECRERTVDLHVHKRVVGFTASDVFPESIEVDEIEERVLPIGFEKGQEVSAADWEPVTRLPNAAEAIHRRGGFDVRDRGFRWCRLRRGRRCTSLLNE